jgi:hypothetical protein
MRVRSGSTSPFHCLKYPPHVSASSIRFTASVPQVSASPLQCLKYPLHCLKHASRSDRRLGPSLAALTDGVCWQLRRWTGLGFVKTRMDAGAALLL